MSFFLGGGENILGGKSPSTGRRRLGSPEETEFPEGTEVPEGDGGSGWDGGSGRRRSFRKGTELQGGMEVPEGDGVSGRGRRLWIGDRDEIRLYQRYTKGIQNKRKK